MEGGPRAGGTISTRKIIKAGSEVKWVFLRTHENAGLNTSSSWLASPYSLRCPELLGRLDTHLLHPSELAPGSTEPQENPESKPGKQEGRSKRLY